MQVISNNKVASFCLINLAGYAFLYNFPWNKYIDETAKRDWDKVIKTYSQDPNIEDYKIYFRRTPEVKKQYEKQAKKSEKLRAKYKTMGDYLYQEVLKPEFNKTQNKFIILKNKFPYNLNVLDHYCFWIEKGHEQEYNTQKAKEIIKKQFDNPQRIEVFENIPRLRTIPEVRHFQVFIQH